MYSVLQIGAHQYRVETGDLIDVQTLDAESGSTIDLNQVLFVSGGNLVVGTPLVEKAKVSALVVKQGKGRKITVFKRRPGLWQKKQGHRQNYTSLLITQIDDGHGNISKIKQESKAYEKYLKGPNGSHNNDSNTNISDSNNDNDNNRDKD